MGGPKNGNFPLLYVVKMSLRRWMGGSKKPQNTLKQYKDGPLLQNSTNIISSVRTWIHARSLTWVRNFRVLWKSESYLQLIQPKCFPL